MKTNIAEYVSPGHPDRLADAIVESVVDLAVSRDPEALVGVECAVHTDHVFIDGRIAEIDNILNHAIIIEESDDFSGFIGLGCRVVVRDLETGEEEAYQVVGSQEADPMNGKISDDSPFGRAMVGKTKGDKVTVDAPVGTLSFEVVSVEK